MPVEAPQTAANEPGPPGDGAERTILRNLLDTSDAHLVPTTLSKGALVELCHVLEDLVQADGVAGTVFAGFQHAWYLRTEAARYQQLAADPGRHAVVFTAEATGVDDEVERIVTGEDHPLAREWFVVALTDRFSAFVLGRELATPKDPVERDRRFITVWSFEPEAVGRLLDALASAVEDLPPAAAEAIALARWQHPPHDGDPTSTQRFTNAVFERLDAYGQSGRRPAGNTAGDAAMAATEVGGHLTGGIEDQPPRPGSEETERTDVGAWPADRDEPAAVAVAPDPDAPGTDEHAEATEAGLHALVVDDEAAIRGLLEALLRRAGWSVTAVSSVDAALAAVRDTLFEAVLIDVRLAGADAADFLLELEGLRPHVRARTAFLAGDPPSSGSLVGRPVLPKPFLWQEVEAVLATLVADDPVAGVGPA